MNSVRWSFALFLISSGHHCWVHFRGPCFSFVSYINRGLIAEAGWGLHCLRCCSGFCYDLLYEVLMYSQSNRLATSGKVYRQRFSLFVNKSDWSPKPADNFVSHHFLNRLDFNFFYVYFTISDLGYYSFITWNYNFVTSGKGWNEPWAGCQQYSSQSFKQLLKKENIQFYTSLKKFENEREFFFFFFFLNLNVF